MNTHPTDDSRLLTAKEAAEYLGLSEAHLANMRCAGSDLAFYKVGKYVRYDEGDLRAWMRSRRYTSTSQAAA